WKGLIIYHLLDETLRFNELSRRVGSVTQRSLTKQLRELEADGIVHREVYAVVPPKVEYRLTGKGQQLREAIVALRQWGVAHPRDRVGAE
ncbi:MAG: helix-turn-helix domain-containing protein, partial [Pseudomonadota bacterium]